ncbi:MAG TPA: hypothetical protein VKD24_10205 [Candidatus Angelobacter sp.]|nr:hypothetical protein [Candidatus Angelobacter sp.]
MNKKAGFAVVLPLLMIGNMLLAYPSAGVQEPGEKDTKDQQAEKSKTANVVDKAESSQMNFPQTEGPVELRPARGTRITLKMADSSRAVYEAIGRQAKISVLFDPDYTPRAISVDLNGVSLQDALKIVAFESRTFWRPVTSDSIFVAADTQAKRREFEQQMLKTFYFPNISSASDLQDIVNSLRTLIEVQRVQQVPSHQSILVRATPEQMALVEKLVNDLNQAKQKTGGEYRLEYKVNETSEDKKLTSRTYTLLIEPHQTGKLRIGGKVPIDAGEGKKTYTDVGKNIDCQVRFETEHTVSLRITLEFSDIAGDERQHDAVQSPPGNPVIQRIEMDTGVTLELGTPTIVGSFQDPVSKHNFQIEATATRTKSRE